MTTERRRFIVKAGGAMAAVAASAIVDAPNVIAQPKVQWRMSTAWPPALKVMQGSALRLAKVVEETARSSGSRPSAAARSCRGSAACSAGLGGTGHRQGGRPSPTAGDGWTRGVVVATMATNGV